MNSRDIDRTQFYTREFIESAIPGGRWQSNGEYLCAIRDERTPSCYINPRKGTYDDFGGKNGKLSDLLREMNIPDPYVSEKGAAQAAPRSPEAESAIIQRQKAREIWETATEGKGHPYLSHKGVEAHGARRMPTVTIWKDDEARLKTWEEDVLIVPCYAPDGTLTAIEQIYGDGTKRALGAKSGSFFILGAIDPEKPVIVCEGYATAASVKAISNWNTVCAFGYANLEKAANAVRKLTQEIVAIAPDSMSADLSGDFDVVTFPGGYEKNTDWNDLCAKHGPEIVKQMFRDQWTNRRKKEKPAEKPSREFRFIDIDELDVRPPQWLVKGFLEKDTLSSLFGASESGKSFLAVDLALCVASGAPFGGCSVATEGLALYIAGEGASGIRNRIAAWCKSRDIPRKGLPFALSSQSADMLDADSLQNIIAQAEAAAERHGAQPVLIVLDTLSRNFGSGDENSSQDMKTFIDNLDTLRLHFPECTVLTVHHSGHADKSRARGSTVFRAAMDSEYLVERENEFVSVKNTKSKDAPRREDLTFQFEDVVLGEGEDGEEYGSAVLRLTDEAPQKDKALPKQQQLALQAFREAVEDFGQTDRIGRFKGVRVSDWLEVFCDSRDGARDTKKKAFDRAVEALAEKKHVKINADMATFAGNMAEFFSNEAAKKINSRKERIQNCADIVQPDISDMSRTCPPTSENRTDTDKGMEYPCPVRFVRPDIQKEDEKQKQKAEEEKSVARQEFFALLDEGVEVDMVTGKPYAEVEASLPCGPSQAWLESQPETVKALYSSKLARLNAVGIPDAEQLALQRTFEEVASA